MSQSPRSANEPMAFTDAELLRGAFIAGLTFVLAAPLVAIVVTIASPHDPQTLGIAISVILIATLTALVPITVLTLIVMTPIARAIGRRLRRNRVAGRTCWPSAGSELSRPQRHRRS